MLDSKSKVSRCYALVDDNPTPRALLKDPEVSGPLSENDVKGCLFYLKKVITMNSKDKEKCWGHLSVSLTGLGQPDPQCSMAVKDRIGYHEDFKGWRSHFSLYVRQELASRCGIMLMIDLEDDHRFSLMVLAQNHRDSKFIRKSRRTGENQGKVSKDIQGALRRTMLEIGIPYTFHAWFDVFFKKAKFYKITSMKVVAGSLGLGEDEDDIWWEHGDKDWTTFAQFTNTALELDAYFCLEDQDEKVYDVLRPELECALLHTGVHLQNESFPRAVNGETRAEMKSRGIHYIPAPEMSQTLLIHNIRGLNKPTLIAMGL
eukprot:jgi/Picsp_1/1931/NSC_05397-R1_---NA---